MKRLVLLTALASAVFVSNAPAANTPVIVRASTERVTIKVTPKRDRFKPYTFTTRGRIVPPGRYCAPGVNPTPGAGNCIPVLCVPGTKDPIYCLHPGRSVICSGVVTVRFQKRTTTISARIVGVRRDCTYRSKVSFRLREFTRRGTLRVRARFQGNPVLLPKVSRVVTVRAR